MQCYVLLPRECESEHICAKNSFSIFIWINDTSENN